MQLGLSPMFLSVFTLAIGASLVISITVMEPSLRPGKLSRLF